MKKRQVTLWVSLLLVAMVVLSGCAPRAGAGMTGAEGEGLAVIPAEHNAINAQAWQLQAGDGDGVCPGPRLG